MRDLIRRALHAGPELATELWRRGFFNGGEEKDFLRSFPAHSRTLPLGPVQFATLLAHGDSQLAAGAVRNGLLRPDELSWLHRLIRFQKPNSKRDELARIVERSLEGRKGNVRVARCGYRSGSRLHTL